jgi:hypothetical protein
MSRALCERSSREWRGERASPNEAGWISFMICEEAPSKAPTPSDSNSKRGELRAQLRVQRAWAHTHADDEIIPPTDAAIESAKTFIHCLPNGFLKIRLAISQGGEINFFAGDDERLLQILIDEQGALSYYGQTNDGPIYADSIPVDKFPQMQLFKFD